MFDKLFVDPDKEGFPLLRCIFFVALFWNGRAIADFIINRKIKNDHLQISWQLFAETLAIITLGAIACVVYVLVMAVLRWVSSRIEAKTYGNDKIEAFKNQLKRLTSNIDTENITLEKLQKEVKTQETKIENNKTQVEIQNKKITELINNRNEIELEIDNQNQTKKLLADEIIKNTNKNNDLIAQNLKLTQTIEENQEEVTEIVRKAKELKKQAIVDFTPKTPINDPKFNSVYEKAMKDLA